LSFKEWLELWGDRITDRGPHKGELVLCRKNDVGPYAVGNCYIARTEHNSSVRGNNETRTNCYALGNHIDQWRHWNTRDFTEKVPAVQTETHAKKLTSRKLHKLLRQAGLR
jgi:hypothetical protein